MALTPEPFVRTWEAFHLGGDAQWPVDRPPVDLAGQVHIPSELILDGRTLRPSHLAQDGTALDLYPLTVPAGFGWRQNVAVLFAEVESDAERVIQLSAGADWYMAWWCNGQKLIDTFSAAWQCQQACQRSRSRR